MAYQNTQGSYGSVAKFLHWLVFFIIVALLIVGTFMGDIGDKALKGQVYNIHKLTGLTLLSLMLVRAAWTLNNPKPKLPLNTKAWERLLEKSGHLFLYFLLFAMPLSGWIMSTAAGYNPHFFHFFSIAAPMIPKSKPLSEFANLTHEVLAWTIVVVVSLHVLAALKHHYVNKDSVLKRMMPVSVNRKQKD